MPKISVWFPNEADGTPLEVPMFGVFDNKSVTEVEAPLYVHDPETGELVETDFLVVGTPIPDENIGIFTGADTDDGGNE